MVARKNSDILFYNRVYKDSVESVYYVYNNYLCRRSVNNSAERSFMFVWVIEVIFFKPRPQVSLSLHWSSNLSSLYILSISHEKLSIRNSVQLVALHYERGFYYSFY